ncbi:MAG: DUF1475 family protein [Fuerstiella sp.]
MTSKKTLVSYAVIALLLMVPFTVRAMNVRGVFDNAALMADVWFQVTLLDAYLAFFCVWIFVCRLEKSATSKALWLLGILSLGSMAIAAYILKMALVSETQQKAADSEKLSVSH